MSKYRRIQNAALRDFRSILELARQLSEVGPDAIRRVAETSESDGFGGGRSDAPGGRGGISDLTYAAAVAEAQRDPVQTNALGCAQLAGKIADSLVLAIGMAKAATKDGPRTVGERANSTTPCLVCGESAEGGAAGYCRPCYDSWRRYRSTHPGEGPVMFRAWRRARLDLGLDDETDNTDNKPLTRAYE